MREMFRRSTDGSILCRPCLPVADVAVSAELFPNLFPGTWHNVTCIGCGYAPPPEGEVTAEAASESPAGSLRSA